MKRSERLIVLTNLLTKNPNVLFSLKEIGDMTGAAKSTLSEDLMVIRELLNNYSLGDLVSVSGAAGGVKFCPVSDLIKSTEFLNDLARKLSDPARIIPGGFIYMTDLIYDPNILNPISEIFYRHFVGTRPDYVITIETKGIPIAMMVARVFNVPLVIVRDDNKVTEGTTVSINYVSGSTKRIQTMSLSRRALPAGARILVIDDFMKAGGTAKGILDLMAEFDAEVVGVGVLITRKDPEVKMVKKYFSLLELVSIQEGRTKIRPTKEALV